MIRTRITFLVLATLSLSSLNAQDCNCTIAQVLDNIVTPCTTTIGTEILVTSESEFANAISTVNSSGGNMTILIADGTYQVASTASYPYITASNLVIRSQSGNRDAVILTGGGMQDVAPSTENILSLNGDNVTIADLTLRDCGNHAIAMNSSENHLVHNVRIQNTYEQMIKGTSADGGADNCRVQCTLFEYTAGVGPQFYIGGIDVHQGDNWIVNDNAFYNIASPSGSLAEHAVHFWNSSSNNTVERNLIVNCDRGVGFGLGSSPSEGGMIRNNMIYNDGSHLFDDVGIGLETSPNTKVYNNTIMIEYPRAIEYRFPETSNVDIVNNLTNKDITSRNNGSGNIANNLTTAQSSWFVDLSSGDLRLNSAQSEVVNQGLDLGTALQDDIDQTARPAGALDIGAHEFNMTTSTDVDLENASITIYPNPVINQFTITGTLSSYDLEILDAQGQVFQTLPSTGNSTTIDLTNLPSGLYYIRISHQGINDLFVRQIIKF